MFDQLPKLFDKNFAIAYFLPSVGFVLTTYFLVIQFNLIEPLLSFSKDSLLNDIAIVGLASLVMAMILLVFNRKLVRFMEGYWEFSLFGLSIDLIPYFNRLELRRYRKLDSKKRELKEKQNNYDERQLKNRINRIEKIRANEFPAKEYLILPTSFGNTYRSFESYAKAMYGIEGIIGWYRLSAVIPENFSNLMNDSRARVDFGVNLWFVNFLLTVEYIIIAIYAIRVPNLQSFFNRETLWWFPLLTLVVSYMSYLFAKNAVSLWGNWVKTAFDLYLPELRKKLELPTPKNVEEERKMWEKFNMAAHYRLPELMPRKKTTLPNDLLESDTSLKLPDVENVKRIQTINTALQILQEDLDRAKGLLKLEPETSGLEGDPDVDFPEKNKEPNNKK